MSEGMNEKAKNVLDLIRKNPYVSQQDLAESIGLSRPAIANIISSLTRKGKIVGRAYILNDTQPVTCIGGANLDRKFHTKDKVQLGTSNPSYATHTVGGVARNIAENIGRLGLEVSLITTGGIDKDWSIIEEASSLYMNLDNVTQFPGKSTGSYTAVLDSNGELIVALADMEVYETITPELLLKHEVLISRSKCLIVDLNCPKDTIEFLCQFANSQDIPIAIIPVSAPKMNRLPSDLQGVTWLITNRDESEAFFNIKIKDEQDSENALKNWLKLGVTNVVITNGKQGSIIGNKEDGIFHVPAFKTNEIVDVTGAGDAFSSAVIYSWLEGKSLIEIAKAGSINAYKTLQSPYTVRQDLSAGQLQKDMEELT